MEGRWVKIRGCDVWTEDGRAIHAAVGEGVDRVTAYIYKSVKDGWKLTEPKVGTLRAGLKAGNYRIM